MGWESWSILALLLPLFWACEGGRGSKNGPQTGFPLFAHLSFFYSLPPLFPFSLLRNHTLLSFLALQPHRSPPLPLPPPTTTKYVASQKQHGKTLPSRRHAFLTLYVQCANVLKKEVVELSAGGTNREGGEGFTTQLPLPGDQKTRFSFDDWH